MTPNVFWWNDIYCPIFTIFVSKSSCLFTKIIISQSLKKCRRNIQTLGVYVAVFVVYMQDAFTTTQTEYQSLR